MNERNLKQRKDRKHKPRPVLANPLPEGGEPRLESERARPEEKEMRREGMEKKGRRKEKNKNQDMNGMRK